MTSQRWCRVREGGQELDRARGFSLLEALVATLLLFLVLQSGLAVFSQFRVAVSRVAHRAEVLETIRTVAWILPEELSGGQPGRDWGPVFRDSIPLRAFRGLAMVSSGFPGGKGMSVCYRGIRAPNAEKDSVLLLGTDGRWTPHELVSRVRGEAGCMSVEEGWWETWRLDPAPVESVLARVFERGSYHIADGAFRYRRGRGGRQPLTPERISVGGFNASGGESTSFSWDMEMGTFGGLGPPISWRGSAW